MKTRFIALVIALSFFVLGIGNSSYAKGKTTKKAQTTQMVKKSTTGKTADMQKKDTSAMKSKKQVASANHHKVHKMTKTSKTKTKSPKSSAKTSKTSKNSKKETPKSEQ